MSENLPKDWELKPIRRLGRIITGKTPPKIEKKYFDGEFMFVSPKDLDYDLFYVHHTETKITGEALKKFKNQVLPPNSILFTSLSYSFGKLGITKEKCLTNQQINSIIANEENDYKFIYYLLRASEPFIFQYNSGIDTPIVPKSVFEKIKLLVPTLPIQKRISFVLSAYDELIEINIQRIKLLEETATQFYQEWFMRMRFPKKWRIKKLSLIPINELIAKTIGGGWGSEVKTHKQNNLVYVLRGTDFEEVLKGNFKTVPLRYESDVVVKTRTLKEGDIVIENSVNASSRCTGKSTIITKAILDQFQHPLIPASFCKLIRPKNPALSRFIWINMSILYEVGLMEYYQNVATNGIGNFQMNRFLSRHLIPYQEKQKDEIIKLFELFDTSIYVAQISHLKQIRDRLLPRLISGKLVVKMRTKQNAYNPT